MISYKDFIDEIQNAPVTWLPGILICVVRTCLRRNVFVKDGFDKTISCIKSEFEA
jgi:hypothetical protein